MTIVLLHLFLTLCSFFLLFFTLSYTNNSIIQVLEDNNIHTLGTLCGKSKTYLKELDLTQSQINKVEIELQLMGLNLKNSL